MSSENWLTTLTIVLAVAIRYVYQPAGCYRQQRLYLGSGVRLGLCRKIKEFDFYTVSANWPGDQHLYARSRVDSIASALNRQKKPLNGCRVLVLGIACKKDIALAVRFVIEHVCGDQGVAKQHLERRKCKRYLVRAQVAFSWADSKGGRHQGAGFTVNISPMGIFVLCLESPPPLHSDLTLEVTLPSLNRQRQGLRLKSGGRVLRVEQTPGSIGFAATTDFQIGNGKYTISVQ